MAAETPALETITVAVADLRPNPWNPNVMDEGTYARARRSIETFGFIDPVTVRRLEDAYQIIDGQHRVEIAGERGIAHVPAVVLDVTDDEARELTIILNEVRGAPDEDRLAELVRDLGQRRERTRMEGLLYDRARLDQLIERRRIDWDALDEPGPKPERKREDPWVERVYRLPRSSASVIDEAVERVMGEEDIEQDWRALEMIAADFLGS